MFFSAALQPRADLPGVPPDQALAHFGFVGMFALRDAPVSSRLTRERLGWVPAGPGLVEDIEARQVATA